MTQELRIWELPEVLLYRIASFSAAETHRAAFLCNQIGTLSKSANRSVMEEKKSIGLWDLVLAGDYGVDLSSKTNGTTRRSCKRLRRSPLQQVKDAHKLLRDNTEIAYFYVFEN